MTALVAHIRWLARGGCPRGGDSFQFVYQQVTGNFTLIADLTSMEVPASLNSANVIAGLMIRNSLDAVSPHYYTALRGNKQVRAGWRKLVNPNNQDNKAYGTLATLPSDAAPVKMKLQRVGQTITVSYSINGGTDWVSGAAYAFAFGADATSTALGSTVYVGLISGSGSTTVTSASIFKNVSLTLD